MVNLIAELGINHRGEIDVAKELIIEAKQCNCWGIKFQYRNTETFYSAAQEIGDEILLDEIIKTKLSIEELLELSNFARDLDLKVGISFFRIEDFNDLSDHLNYFDFFKVPSAEAINIPLINELTFTKKMVMVSLGGHYLEQIIDAYKDVNKNNIVVFHCVANYPAKIGSQNLLFLNKLKEIGFKSIGYSSHDEDYEVCFLAASMGASYIERHLTKNVKGSGLDDSSSSDVIGFARLGKIISNFDSIMGNELRVPNQGEKLNMQNLGTSIYTKVNIKKGSSVNLENLEIKAPRKGISIGEFLLNYNNKKVTRNIKAKNPIQALDFEEPEEELSEKMLSFAMHRKIAIPIRLYDCDFYFKNINTNFFEFHLSYGEVLSDELFNLLKMSELKGKSFSIHLPDYIHGNRIIDPISDDVSIRNESVDLISRVIDFSRKLEDISGNSVPIVGSFSESKSSSRRKNLDRIFNYLDTSQGGSGKILPQWLPVYAWYFGGSAKLDIFNSLEDIEYIKEYDRKLCLDICHLVLSANYYKKDPMDWFELLKYHSSHVHIADGIGVDGEGLQLGEGQLKEYKKFLEIDAMKVLEVWQGHHNHGNGFIKAIRYLYNEK